MNECSGACVALLMWSWVVTNAWSSAAKRTYTLLSIWCLLLSVCVVSSCNSNSFCFWAEHLILLSFVTPPRALNHGHVLPQRMEMSECAASCFVIMKGQCWCAIGSFCSLTVEGKRVQTPLHQERRRVPLIQCFLKFLSKWDHETSPSSVFPFQAHKISPDSVSNDSPPLSS